MLQLRNGILQLHTSNGHNAAFLGLNVTDGQWHHILLRQTTDGHGLRIDVDASGNADAVDSDTDTARVNFSLTNFAADRMARISVGRVADQDGVKVRNVILLMNFRVFWFVFSYKKQAIHRIYFLIKL